MNVIIFNNSVIIVYIEKIYQRDVLENFRYKSKEELTKISSYYEKKRYSNIKSLHFLFMTFGLHMFQKWHQVAIFMKDDRSKLVQYSTYKTRSFFQLWLTYYQHSFRERTLIEIRKRGLKHNQFTSTKIDEDALYVQKTLLISLWREKGVLRTKVQQFDRLSQNHSEAVLKRNHVKEEIEKATKLFFIQKEEHHLIDYYNKPDEIRQEIIDIRVQMARGFVYHIQRSIKSFESQGIALQYNQAFRAFSDPIIQKAVSYFNEKKQLTRSVKRASPLGKTIAALTNCVRIYHSCIGLKKWIVFMENISQQRTPGIMDKIRRRVMLLQLFPYFDLVECLPVRPPKSLKEIEQENQNLPKSSIQQKISQERDHHINVRMMLARRRMLRDFFRGYASLVQKILVNKDLIKIFEKKRNFVLERKSVICFRVNKNLDYQYDLSVLSPPEKLLKSDLNAWRVHFLSEKHRLNPLVELLPYKII